MAKQRRVLGSNGMIMMTFPESKLVEEVTMKEVEVTSETNIENSIAITEELINSMELNELRVIAKDNNIKLGRISKDKAREIIITELLGTAEL